MFVHAVSVTPCRHRVSFPARAVLSLVASHRNGEPVDLDQHGESIGQQGTYTRVEWSVGGTARSAVLPHSRDQITRACQHVAATGADCTLDAGIEWATRKPARGLQTTA